MQRWRGRLRPDGEQDHVTAALTGAKALDRAAADLRKDLTALTD